MPPGEQINLNDLLRETGRGIKIPLAFVVIFTLATCVYIAVVTPLYEARITITDRPVGDGSVGGSKLLDFGSLGALAGAKKFSNYDKLIAILVSNDTALEFLTHGDLMARFFPNKWDGRGMGAWRPPTGVRAAARALLNRVLGVHGWISPGSDPVLNLFDSHVRITANDGGRSHTLSFYAPDPRTASEALNVLLHSADRILRERGQKESSEKLLFLRRQLSVEQLVEVRTTLATEMGKEFVTTSMLAGQTPYSYQILKEEWVSTMPTWPRPFLALVIATMSGFLLGCLVIVFRAGNAPVRLRVD